jgi:hypothetical protein
MKNHWPLLLAIIMIGLAGAAGTFWVQHRESQLNTSQAKPAKPATEAPQPVADALPSVPETTTELPQPAKPQQRPVAQAVPIQPAPNNPPVVQQPVARTNAAQPTQNPVLLQLKTVLQNAGGAPIDLAGSAYAFDVAGARIEVQPTPNWSITIYNKNRKVPSEETDDFKQYLAAVTSTLSIDTAKAPIVGDDNKSYLRTSSKMGTITLTRDPANGNLCTVKPLGPPVPVAAPANGQEKPKPAENNF